MSKIFSLAGKTALIFGGTSGLGRAIALGFVQEKATVIPVSRDRKKVGATVKELARAGNSWSSVLTCDVQDKAQITQTCGKILKQLKRIDIMVCAAGIHLKKPSETISEQEWRHVLDVNLSGTFFANQIAGKIMLKQKEGKIINIASLGSYVALSEALPYCVSKSGVLMLTQCLGTEWANKGVRVNAIVPGVFPTPLNKKALSDKTRLHNILKRTPMQRLGNLEEIVGISLFLASEASGFVTGSAFTVDGGFLASSGF